MTLAHTADAHIRTILHVDRMDIVIPPDSITRELAMHMRQSCRSPRIEARIRCCIHDEVR